MGRDGVSACPLQNVMLKVPVAVLVPVPDGPAIDDGCMVNSKVPDALVDVSEVKVTVPPPCDSSAVHVAVATPADDSVCRMARLEPLLIANVPAALVATPKPIRTSEEPTVPPVVTANVKPLVAICTRDGVKATPSTTPVKVPVAFFGVGVDVVLVTDVVELVGLVGELPPHADATIAHTMNTQ